MGKFRKKRADGVKPSRNVPLAEQLLEEKSVRHLGREKQRRRREEDDDVCNCRRWGVTKHRTGPKYKSFYMDQSVLSMDGVN